MKLLMSLVVVLTATAGAPRRAHADCGLPRWIGTPSGATLPVHGSLYVHDEGHVRGRPAVSHLAWTGFGRAAAAVPISETVIRIDYDASLAEAVKLDLDGYDTYAYAFDAQWRAPKAAPRVLQYWHHESAWACSSSDSVMIQVDQPTAAFEVSWTFNGVTRTFIEPARTDGDQSALELGKINCGTTSIEPDELAWGGDLALTAIRFDGSRVAVTGMPGHLRLGELSTSDDGLARAFILRPPVVAAPHAAAPEPAASPRFVVIGLLLLSLGVLIGLRFRVKPPTMFG